MKGLSVKEPWATLILRCGKTTENRSWRTHYRGPLVICASKKIDDMFSPGWKHLTDYARCKELEEDSKAAGIICGLFASAGWNPAGHALGVVDVVGCDRDMMTEWDMPDQWHWRLENPRPFVTPFPFKGQLGFFDVDDSLIAEAFVVRKSA